MKIKIYLLSTAFLLSTFILRGQESNSKIWGQSYDFINKMLIGDSPLSFKDAVIGTEIAFNDGKFDVERANQEYVRLVSIAEELSKSNLITYTEKDKDIVFKHAALFKVFTDTISIQIEDRIIKHSPFKYNHTDFAGQQDWSNMFVSTLMQTKVGNCHSLPYLYKIIMDELGYESHLAIAPNHIYIKANNKKVGWYNIELTCGDFPTDAWYAASGYIHTDAIRNGIYMRALSDKEAVAMTLVDLAQGYRAKFGIGDGSFIIMCCNTALKYFPNYINAMLLKAEILTELYRESNDKGLFSQMTELYADIHQLGYRKMPRQMYANWLNSLNTEDRNQGIKAILNPKTKTD